jgi:hypothetical protein
VIAAGGFDTYLSLFAGTGPTATFLDSNDDGGCGPASPDPVCEDSQLDLTALAAGDYTIALTLPNNFSIAENYGFGDLGGGFIDLQGDYYDFQLRLRHYVGHSPWNAAAALRGHSGAVLWHWWRPGCCLELRYSVASAIKQPLTSSWKFETAPHCYKRSLIMKFSRFPLATLVVLAAALTPFVTIPARAQKPALTENIDEKGRVPYHSNFQALSQANSGAFLFKSVPAGYRLVVTHASARYFGNPAPSALANYAILGGGATTPGDSDGYSEYLPTPVSGGGTSPSYVAASPVTYYVEPLGIPNIFISNMVLGTLAYGSISGYLVALN